MKKFVYGQSGVNGFFGETKLLEYLYQLFYWLLPSYSFKGTIFVSKTATLNPRVGNTELRSVYKIKRFFPKSIWVSWKSFKEGYMLNAVGLSNPGLKVLLDEKKWQKRTEFFHLSIQLDKTETDEVKDEVLKICSFLNREKWNSDFALQVNESCPNTGHEMEQALDLIILKLDLFKNYLPGVPIWVKFNALVDIGFLLKLKNRCEGFVISNTIPFGQAENLIDYQKLFPNGSPLIQRIPGNFTGGLSGLPVYPVLLNCIKQISITDPTIKVIAGGGIFTKAQINELSKYHPVKGIALGCVALLRPLRLQNLIKYGNKIFQQNNK